MSVVLFILPLAGFQMCDESDDPYTRLSLLSGHS